MALQDTHVIGSLICVVRISPLAVVTLWKICLFIKSVKHIRHNMRCPHGTQTRVGLFTRQTKHVASPALAAETPSFLAKLHCSSSCCFSTSSVDIKLTVST